MKRVVLLSLLLAVPAFADGSVDSRERAKALYNEGKRYYDVADYDHAIEAWKQAYVLESAPMLLYNIAQAYRLEGNCTQAMRFYANYEREAGAAVDRPSLDEARARCNPQPTGANPPPTFPVSQPPTATTLSDVDLDSHATAAPTPVPSHSNTKTIGLITAGGGAVLVGIGLYLEHVASDDASKVSNYHGVWTQTQQDWQSSGKSAATWGAVSAGVGVAALAGGAVLYYLGMHSERVVVAVTPNAAGLSWAASF